MDRASWVVAFLGSGNGGLDPERLQHGLHLLGEIGVVPEDQRYEFDLPGGVPTARDLGRDLAALEDGGVVAERTGLTGWTEVKATQAGRREAAILLSRLHPSAVARIREVRRLVGRMHLDRIPA